MKKNFLKVASLALALNILLVSCKKDDEKTAQPQEVTLEDNSVAQNESDDVVSTVEDFLATNGANMRVSGEAGTVAGPCESTATITKNADGNSGTIVIDFGTAGKPCTGGRVHKGKINIAYTGKYRSGNSTQVITFDNYSVNDNKVEGKKTLANTVEGTGNAAKFSTQIKAEGFKITFKDGKTAEWNSDRVRVYDPKGTFAVEDDEISVSGTATGKNRNGISYAASTTNALMLKRSCYATSGWVPVSGVLKVTPADDKTDRIVNYGTGTCDRMVTVTVGSQNWEIAIK